MEDQIGVSSHEFPNDLLVGIGQNWVAFVVGDEGLLFDWQEGHMLAHPFLNQPSLWQVGVDLNGQFNRSFWVQASSEVDKRLPYFLLFGNTTSSNGNNDHQG